MLRRELAAGNVIRAMAQGDRIFGEFNERPDDPKWIEKQEEAERAKAAEQEAEKEKAAKSDEGSAEEQPAEEAEEKPEPDKLHKHFVTTVSLFGDHSALENELQEKLGHRYSAKQMEDSTGMFMLLSLSITILFFVAIWIMFRRARDQFLGGGLLSGFTKSPARRYEAEAEPVTFKDVAGLEGVKRDLEEIVEFLKDPERFERLGGRVPKGVLLMGPPGTGKTLLARAVAGEAGVPFFSISGSEFIQMFVGVGAGRVRDLFKTAKDSAPSILFIDEIDAVGRHRGAGLGGGNDEREQTLNQILSEMDGFRQSESVIVLAATNRPDVLDPALLRPGRFDRHITVDRPTRKGREEIFKVHVRRIPLADDVDLERLAAGTIGLTGADIRNLVNEAALWATRRGKDAVFMDDFEHARDKILMGAKREEVLSEEEKEMTAYHEAGHALLAWIVPGIDRLHKVTVVPHGRALGVTQLLPEEDRLNISEADLRARLVFMLGGRAAEKLIYDQYSAGAENDLTEATKLARRMVSRWGMSERLGPVAYHATEENPFLGREFHSEREFSEHTAQMIDEEIARILHASADRAMELLRANSEKLKKLAEALVEHEFLDEEDITELIGPSVHTIHETNGRGSGRTSENLK
ncbi:MAG: ATP-dependent zinc metalloprotease FtsH [Planctomycetota bacterium]|nr:MAG: ATP-dependent zinc metalloprotease FtsH [Planctomycetota bacterium]REK21807.1 MAG: ATP-dependent zinc metalloprotease FtsH [Planctomycetota bacterium]REK43256.1 MAG: ATP-dependent zinc metalloprotease FtsH [Planctomycetota bacterium]